MTIERITQGIREATGDRFLLLYGANTSDSFCSEDLILQDIEQVLYRYLKAQGYQRIAFYSGNRKLYFLDTDSRDRALLRPPHPSPVQGQTEIKVTPGPLGRKKRFLGKKDSQQTQETPLQSLPPSHPSTPKNRPQRMQDRDVLPLLQNFMEDTSQSSAIVFANPEDLRRFELLRQLDGAIVEWSRLLPTNPNLCVFIFHQDTYSELQSFCQQIGLTFLSNLLLNRERSQNQVNICNVGTPTASEIGNLIHRFRLQNQLKISWNDFEQLNRALAQESKSLKYWYDRFLSASKFSLKQAEREKWTQIMPLPTAVELTEKLGQKVIGHSEAIATLVKLVRGKIAAQKSPKPLVILLPGPTGTGKTELSKALASALGTPLERCDMGEYGEEHKVSNLFGSPLGYVGSEQGGWLPNTLRRNQQRCILLFDEIEKAHESIWRQLLAFFDEGRVSDVKGTVISPKDTICLLTTNLASEAITEAPNLAKEILQKTGYLPPEFIGRIDKVIPLIRLGIAEQTEMIFRLMKRFAQDRYHIEVVVDAPALTALVCATYEPAQNYGGRGVNEAISDLFTDDLLELQSQNINQAYLRVEGEKMQLVPGNLEQPPLDFAALAAGSGRRDQATLEGLLKQLDAMIGLSSVKAAMQELVASEQAKQRLRQAGYETDDRITRHLVFLGNPGTGKTTVAELVGAIFKALGILKRGQLIKVDKPRDSLVAEYVGQTAPKTRAKVEEALDGILFIDEAYALASPRGGGQDYGQEAVDTLVPMLENYRDRLVVIFAGYTQPMQAFLATNPGLQSRIAKIIEFPDYTGEEMLEIFLSYCRTSKPPYRCPPEVQQAVLERLNQMYKMRDRNFGNGRDVRNLFEAMVQLQQVRLIRDNLEGEAMITFAKHDLPPFNLD
ncbi:AAA family ATPase [Laspinema olomoucense]|uniref:AAA family ATPase n=1 Tax=Laspinema olomoucense TaxID=3231600 RepID=UPI0021BABE2E|nr:AAA family ATPase [Laspinema sp. D3c]MCT7997509.1 AAA family ATPase [Laspinema sp. D3c]